MGELWRFVPSDEETALWVHNLRDMHADPRLVSEALDGIWRGQDNSSRPKWAQFLAAYREAKSERSMDSAGTTSAPLSAYVGRRMPSGAVVEAHGLRRPAGWRGQGGVEKNATYRPWHDMPHGERERVLAYLRTSTEEDPGSASSSSDELSGFSRWAVRDREWILGHYDHITVEWIVGVIERGGERRAGERKPTSDSEPACVGRMREPGEEG